MDELDVTPYKYNEFNNGLHWRLKAHDNRVFDYWPTTGRWRALVGKEAGYGTHSLWPLLTGQEPDYGDPADYTPTAVCDDCGAHALRNEPIVHGPNCKPGEGKFWENFYSKDRELTEGEKEDDIPF